MVKQPKEINWLWVVLVALMGTTIALSYTDTVAYNVAYPKVGVEFEDMFFHGWGTYAVCAVFFSTKITWLHGAGCVISLGNVWLNFQMIEIYKKLSGTIMSILPMEGILGGSGHRFTALGTTVCVLSVCVTAFMLVITVICAKDNRERKRLAVDALTNDGVTV